VFDREGRQSAASTPLPHTELKPVAVGPPHGPTVKPHKHGGSLPRYRRCIPAELRVTLVHTAVTTSNRTKSAVIRAGHMLYCVFVYLSQTAGLPASIRTLFGIKVIILTCYFHRSEPKGPSKSWSSYRYNLNIQFLHKKENITSPLHVSTVWWWQRK
jgi:hypothetical protein